MNFNPELRFGEIISNNKIVSIFKCGNMGGMRRSHATNSLILIMDHTKSFYKDSRNRDKVKYMVWERLDIWNLTMLKIEL